MTLAVASILFCEGMKDPHVLDIFDRKPYNKAVARVSWTYSAKSASL